MIGWLVNAAAAAIVTLIAAGTAAADPIAVGEEHCVVNVRSDDALNMREAPHAGARIEGRLRYGDCGVIVREECRGSWCPVEGSHRLGWVHRRYISMVSPAMYCVTGVATGDALNLRAYPSDKSRVLTRLDRRQCDIAFLPYSVGNWQKIRVEGWQGWVNRRHLSGQ